MNMLTSLFTALGQFTLVQLRGVGKLTLFTLEVMKRVPSSLARFFLIVQ
jgi:hypothetical protein